MHKLNIKILYISIKFSAISFHQGLVIELIQKLYLFHSMAIFERSLSSALSAICPYTRILSSLAQLPI